MDPIAARALGGHRHRPAARRAPAGREPLGAAGGARRGQPAARRLPDVAALLTIPAHIGRHAGATHGVGRVDPPPPPEEPAMSPHRDAARTEAAAARKVARLLAGDYLLYEVTADARDARAALPARAQASRRRRRSSFPEGRRGSASTHRDGLRRACGAERARDVAAQLGRQARRRPAPGGQHHERGRTRTRPVVVRAAPTTAASATAGCVSRARLHLRRAHPARVHLEEVVGAAEVAVDAVLVLAQHVAHPQPRAADQLAGLLGAPPVAAGVGVAADPQAPRLARGRPGGRRRRPAAPRPPPPRGRACRAAARPGGWR